MGARTEANLKAFADQTGIRPATGGKLDRLNTIQELALELIRLAELEKSGICGGDGAWYGCDPIEGVAREIHEATQRRDEPVPDTPIRPPWAS
ncbi:MAG: hypothetical protein FKY71_20205 [Spiribacter salinus]|uniref:Uncharacterized protein n=1 Tax=Spiribacter salinus TaxID=1335746 RepID=A0A540V416_9GAMM|nr:MAG: hypothetical protein FKY71_20205 [Spiribacter salinus]